MAVAAAYIITIGPISEIILMSVCCVIYNFFLIAFILKFIKRKGDKIFANGLLLSIYIQNIIAQLFDLGLQFFPPTNSAFLPLVYVSFYLNILVLILTNEFLMRRIKAVPTNFLLLFLDFDSSTKNEVCDQILQR